MKKNNEDNFHKLDTLEIYQLAKELAYEIYSITKGFPKEEQFGLTAQIRRCVISIGANIAEGYGRFHYKDELRFDYIARGSLFETFFFFELALKLKYIEKDEFQIIEKKLRNFGVRLNNYINYLKKKSY